MGREVWQAGLQYRRGGKKSKMGVMTLWRKSTLRGGGRRQEGQCVKWMLKRRKLRLTKGCRSPEKGVAGG